MVAFERIHDDMSTWSTVINIPQDVQLIDNQALNNLTDGNDEIVSSSRSDNRMNDSTYVIGLVFIVRMFVKKLLNDIREVRR